METGFYDYTGENRTSTDEYFKEMKELKEKRFGEK